MEKMCLSQVLCDRGENEEDSMAEQIICANGPESPAVETVTHSRKSKIILCVDDDIPSYQIVRGSKRFSDVVEEQDSILPISPVVTPPRIEKKENFQVPFVPTIGTIVKKNASFKAVLPENLDVTLTKESTKKYKSAYEVLGMVDNDISWNSAMETPTDKLLPLGDYNTIERATLLPEKDLKNMHPRVLFSPHENDDSDCVPLKYSSESEDDKDSCSTKLASPTMGEINVKIKTLGSLKETTEIKNDIKNESPKTTARDDNFMGNSAVPPISPIFRISRKTSKKRKRKSLLVKSPDIVNENNVKNSYSENPCETNKDIQRHCDVQLCSEVPVTAVTEVKETNNDHNMNEEPEDDCLQNISISCFDELCNTSDLASDSNLVCDNIIPAATKQANFERNDSQKGNTDKHSSPTQKKLNSKKFLFYDDNRTDELHPVFSMDNFLKSAEQFEEFNVSVSKKCYETFNDGELMEFNKIVSDDFSGQGLKRLRPVSNKSPDACSMKKKKMEILNTSEEFMECTKIKEERTGVEHVKKQEVTVKTMSTQSGINDNQISMTAISTDRLVDNRRETCCETPRVNVNEQVKNDQLINNQEGTGENNRMETKAMFFTTPDKGISLSSDLNLKASNTLDHDCKENFRTASFHKENNVWKSGFQGFQTASGNTIKVSKKALNEAKKLFLESDVNGALSDPDPVPENVGFTTASGRGIKISEQSLKKAKKVLSELDDIDFQENTEIKTEVIKEEFVGFKTASNKSVKISEESIKKANELWKQMEDIPAEKNSILFQNSELKGNIFREKTQGVRESADESCWGTKPDSGYCGFSTASGKSLTVSKSALEKARKTLGEEIVDREEKTIVIEKTGSRNSACLHKANDIILNEKENSFNQTLEETNLDNSEPIPPWVHAYKTSPTFTLEYSQFKSATPYEHCNRTSTPKERYLVKSPILGKTDRFGRKGKKHPGKKLFSSSPNQTPVNENENTPGCNRMKNSSIKRDSSELGIDFSFLFKRKKIDEDAADLYAQDKKPSVEVLEKRKKARLEQEKAGKKLKVNPVKGSHILKKKEKQISWNEALQGAMPGRFSDETLKNYGIRDDILLVTAANAHTYRFKAEDFFSPSNCLSNVNGFPVGDGCLLIYDDDNTAGVEEITRAFLASPGVEPNLVSPEWVKNHYKWIVWKLSHYERSFPRVFGGNCLTPHNVMVQLKYRYDREVDGSERSAVKKILERDESSRKRIVLCVSGIKKTPDLCNKDTELSNNGLMSYVLELTDGWYSCCAQTDSGMFKLIEEGKVVTGTKLVTYGAELLISDAVSPLEASDRVHLKIFTNSTRRVKWDTKLGFLKNGGPFLVSLNSILPNGGLVSRLDVVIVRIYPMVYMEKRPDGSNVVRNRRTEDKAASEYQEQQEALFQKIYQQVKDEVQSKAKEKEKLFKKVTISDVSKVTDAEELFRLYEECFDPSLFQSLLTAEQSEILLDYQLRKKQIINKELSDMVHEKIKTEKMNIRKVSQLLRVKIVDLDKCDYDNPGLLTVWNPTEDVLQMLSEGKALSIFNTVPNSSRFHKPVQLNTTRYTQYKELTKIVEYPVRKLASLSELTAEYEPVFNEIDVVGIVVFIRETSYGSRLSQTIYLADLEYNFIGLVFWGSCKNLGWENVLTVGSVVACSNLQWGNRRNFSGIPNVYVNDYAVFKDNPKETFLKEGMKVLKSSLPDDMKRFIGKCEDEIIAKLDDEKLSNVSRNTSLPCDSSNNSSTGTIKPKYINGFKMKPSASSTPFKSRAFGLDMSDQEPSPIQKRIEKLLMYGEPPPLTPLPAINLEKFTKFKPPFKSVADSSAK